MDKMSAWRSRDCVQVVDYSGLSFGKTLDKVPGGIVRPMDVDGMLEIHDGPMHRLRIDGEIFIFYEYKYGTHPLRGGQQAQYERMADAICRGTDCRAFVLDISHQDGRGDIDGAAGMVRRVYAGKERKWHELKKPISAYDMTDKILRRYMIYDGCKPQAG